MLAWPLLRAYIGRWPTAAEAGLFVSAFCRPGDAVPPIVRALASVPAARPQLSRAMLASWMLAAPAWRGELGRAGVGAACPPGDVLRAWSGPPVAFMHIEKTGGTSVSRVLEAQFHPTQINPEIFGHQLDREAARYALLRGHFDLPTLRRIDPGRGCVTFLREPRARLLSLYTYWRQQGTEPGIDREVRLASQLSLLQWLRCTAPSLCDSIDNRYTRVLLGAYVGAGNDDRLARDPDGCLAAATAELDRMSFVGVTESMAASLRALSRQFGFPCPPEAPHLNVTGQADSAPDGVARPAKREPLTPEIEAELDRLTRLDRMLYARARARLDGAA